VRYRGYFAVSGVVLLVLAGVHAGPRLYSRLACGQFSFSGDIWSDGGECVGVSDGSYTFGANQVMGKIAELNNTPPCKTYGNAPTPVTIGAMVTLGSLNTGVRAVHELGGFAAAFFSSTQPSSGLFTRCAYRIRLLVAQMGSNEQAAVADARDLVNDGAVAVVGMGLSSQQSADAAAVLGEGQAPIPMVADLATAEGFDHNGSRADNPDYTDCAAPSQTPSADYENGLGPSFFRVSYRAAVQVDDALDSAPRSQRYFIVEPTDTSDPYTCTVLPLIIRGLAKPGINRKAQQLDFDLTQPDLTQDSAATEICSATGRVTVFYTARAVYLSSLLDDLIEDKQSGECSPEQVNVINQSDAAQLRVPAPNASLSGVQRQLAADLLHAASRSRPYRG
jgi:hypothetical protein